MPERLSSTSHNKKTQAETTAQFLPVLQKLVHEEGQTAWKLLESLFNQLEQGLLLADASGNIVVFNQAAQELLGYSEQEIIDRQTLWEICPALTHPPLMQGSSSPAQTINEQQLEIPVNRPGSSLLNVKIRPHYQAGRLLGVVATLNPLPVGSVAGSEHYNPARPAAFDHVFTALAHEINNPLQAIRTSLELGFDQNKSITRRQEYLRVANLEIGRISAIINQLRDFYQSSSGKKSHADINAGLFEATRLLSKQFNDNMITVEIRPADELPPATVFAYQFQQIILNLLRHVQATMPEGGHLIISTNSIDNHHIHISFFVSAEGASNSSQTSDTLQHFSNSERRIEMDLSLFLAHELIIEAEGELLFQPDYASNFVVSLPC